MILQTIMDLVFLFLQNGKRNWPVFENPLTNRVQIPSNRIQQTRHPTVLISTNTRPRGPSPSSISTTVLPYSKTGTFIGSESMSYIVAIHQIIVTDCPPILPLAMTSRRQLLLVSADIILLVGILICWLIEEFYSIYYINIHFPFVGLPIYVLHFVK